MMCVDEYDLELAHAVQRRLDRDDERERVDERLRAVARRPRYSRFRTLARITAAIAAAAQAEQPRGTRQREAA